VSRQSIEAVERLRGRLGFRGSGERGVFLCHTFCELGATPLAAGLEDIHDFLVTHPGDVVVVINQDHVARADFVEAVEDADLGSFVFALPRGSRWPTLRSTIERDQRLVVLAENRAGAAPWYQLAYERLTQETPFTFASRRCAATCSGRRHAQRPVIAGHRPPRPTAPPDRAHYDERSITVNASAMRNPPRTAPCPCRQWRA
jgi:hypothetical protein